MIKKELYAAPQTEVLKLKLGSNVLEVTSPTRENPYEETDPENDNW